MYELWLIQAFCKWRSRAVSEYVRDCQLASAVDVAVQVAKGLQLMEVQESLYQQTEGMLGPEWLVATEHNSDEVLEDSLKGDEVKDAARVGPVRFVSRAEGGTGNGRHWKTDTSCLCGKRWAHIFTEALPEFGRCRRCLRAFSNGVSGGEARVLDP